MIAHRVWALHYPGGSWYSYSGSVNEFCFAALYSGLDPKRWQSKCGATDAELIEFARVRVIKRGIAARMAEALSGLTHEECVANIQALARELLE